MIDFRRRSSVQRPWCVQAVVQSWSASTPLNAKCSWIAGCRTNVSARWRRTWNRITISPNDRTFVHNRNSSDFSPFDLIYCSRSSKTRLFGFRRSFGRCGFSFSEGFWSVSMSGSAGGLGVIHLWRPRENRVLDLPSLCPQASTWDWPLPLRTFTCHRHETNVNLLKQLVQWPSKPKAEIRL